MAKQTKKKTKSRFGFFTKKVRIVAIIVVAIIGTLTITGLFAQSNRNDYSLKLPTKQATISLTNEKPLIVTKESNGQVKYESRGKSINVTSTGTIYCIPENDGAVKIAELTQDQLSQAISQVQSSKPTAGTTEQKKPEASVGRTKKLQISESNSPKTVEGSISQPAEGLVSAEKILDQLCSSATKTIPDSQVPVFTPERINKPEFKQSSTGSILSYITPKVSAGGIRTIAPEVEDDQIRLINNERRIHGLQQLGKSDCLTKAARTWSFHMAIVNTLYHSSLVQNIEIECGTGWWQKLGENVSTGGTSAEVFQAYMNSPGHRANILDGAYQRVGVGANYYQQPNSPWNVLWTTQLFARCMGSCANK